MGNSVIYIALKIILNIITRKLAYKPNLRVILQNN